MQFDRILVGGDIATSERVERADLGIKDGRIAAIGDLNGAPSSEVVDVTGLTVLSGIIDTQVHFREPGMEHKEDIESGTRAAIAGGVTTVFEMPNTNPTTTTAEALADKIETAKGRAWCHIAFFVGAAIDNLDDLGRLETLPGTPGVKMFMGSSTGTLLVPDDEHVLKALQNGRFPMPVHSEDSGRLVVRQGELSDPPSVLDHPIVRDAECARLCTERLIRLAKQAGRPVHVLHISTKDELPLLAAAKQEGQKVTCEITPQHLWFAWPEDYDRLGALVQMNPPMRSSEHRDALRQAVRDGLFDVIGSDHAPHTLEEKAQPYPKSPSGMPGVQTLGPAMLTLAKQFELMDLRKFVWMSSENPARLYGVQNKGRIAVGFDADLAVFDMNAHWTFERNQVQSKCGWSPFEGETFTAKPIHTLVDGEFAYRNGSIVGSPRGTQPTFNR